MNDLMQDGRPCIVTRVESILHSFSQNKGCELHRAAPATEMLNERMC